MGSKEVDLEARRSLRLEVNSHNVFVAKAAQAPSGVPFVCFKFVAFWLFLRPQIRYSA